MRARVSKARVFSRAIARAVLRMRCCACWDARAMSSRPHMLRRDARAVSSRPLASPCRAGWQPVARLVHVSHAPTAHALLCCSRDACGPVIAASHPVLAGSGSGASSGGLAMALGGDEDSRRTSVRVAEGISPLGTASVAAAAAPLRRRPSPRRRSSPSASR